MPFSNGVRVEHVLLLGVFLFVRHAFGKSASNVSDEGEEGEDEEHEEGFVVSTNSCPVTSDHPGREWIVNSFSSAGISHGF